MFHLSGLRPTLRLLTLGAVLAFSLVATATAALARVPECSPAGTSADEHPLLCRAFTADGSEIAWDDLVQRLATYPLVLLGEVHDNPAHHRIRAQMILALAAKWEGQRKPALVAEHITTDQELALSAFRALDRVKQRDASGLFAALAWEKSGWPKAELFEPLFAAALDVEWPILPGNPPRAQVRSVAMQGLTALDKDEVTRLGLSAPLPETGQSSLLDELEASHCGLMPRTAFGGMADAQRYRDAQMARALADAAAMHGRAVLIAGNGHVRRDRGVPWHLERIAPDQKVATVLHLEAAGGKRDIAGYLKRNDAEGAGMADFIVLAARTDRPDPCAKMKERAKR